MSQKPSNQLTNMSQSMVLSNVIKETKENNETPNSTLHSNQSASLNKANQGLAELLNMSNDLLTFNKLPQQERGKKRYEDMFPSSSNVDKVLADFPKRKRAMSTEDNEIQTNCSQIMISGIEGIEISEIVAAVEDDKDHMVLDLSPSADSQTKFESIDNEEDNRSAEDTVTNYEEIQDIRDHSTQPLEEAHPLKPAEVESNEFNNSQFDFTNSQLLKLETDAVKQFNLTLPPPSVFADSSDAALRANSRQMQYGARREMGPNFGNVYEYTPIHQLPSTNGNSYWRNRLRNQTATFRAILNDLATMNSLITRLRSQAAQKRLQQKPRK